MNNRTDRVMRAKVPAVQKAREDAALDMYVRCMTQVQISAVMEVSQGQVSRMISRALARRAKRDPIVSRKARVLMMERLEGMLATWYPRAVGADDGLPDQKAAETTLKILDRIGTISGVDMAPTPDAPTIAVITTDTLRAQVMASLDEAAARARVIEGTLVRAEDPAVSQSAILDG